MANSANDKPVALIVDDEPMICETLAGVLSDEGWDSLIAHSGAEALTKVKASAPDIVFLDVWMEGMDGIETLQHIKGIDSSLPVLVMSGHGSIETAVRATKLGAFDFLEKPLSLEKLLPIVSEAYSARRSNRGSGSEAFSKYEMIGRSKPMEAVRRQVQVIAPRNSWVLISGENGSGKEVVARKIHELSARHDRPFVAVNCAAIPEDLIESELFGHAKGAFTNALQDKQGKFELAHKGTLFLDEIADMSLKTQAKVLRILQEQSFERVGSADSVSVDVRVIAATNKNLPKEIESGKFREDLYYRLNVIPIEVPALRDRPEDVPILVQYFLRQISRELGEDMKSFSLPAMEKMRSYAWPGNVRELRNILERLCILASGSVIDVDDLPSSVLEIDPDAYSHTDHLAVSRGKTLREAKLEFERSFILDSLENNHWNVSKTAESIGVERSNLHRKLRAYDIDPKQLKGDL